MIYSKKHKKYSIYLFSFASFIITNLKIDLRIKFMKQLLQILLNILLFWQYTFTSLIALLWTGKLNKISPYHAFAKKSLRESYIEDVDCQDIYAQSRAFPDHSHGHWISKK